MPHLCTMHTLCLYPSTCLLCPPGGFPGTISSSGQGAWQVRPGIRLASCLPHPSCTRPSQLSLGRWKWGFVQFGVSVFTCQIWVGFSFFLKLVWELALPGRNSFIFSFSVERGATYQGRAMGGTPRPWPKPCRFTRILCAPCTSLEGRTLLPHWIEESFPRPKSYATQIQRNQGGVQKALFPSTNGTKGWGTGPVSQTTSQKFLIFTSYPSPHLVTSDPDPTGPRRAAPVPTIHTGVSRDSQC